MEKFTINATIKDTIDRVDFLNNIKISTKKEISFDNNSNKLEIINSLQNCKRFYFSEDEIYIEVDRTEEERQKDINHYKNVLKYNLSKLKKWFDQENHKAQIKNYLELKNLNWILEEIKN